MLGQPVGLKPTSEAVAHGHLQSPGCLPMRWSKGPGYLADKDFLITWSGWNCRRKRLELWTILDRLEHSVGLEVWLDEVQFKEKSNFGGEELGYVAWLVNWDQNLFSRKVFESRCCQLMSKPPMNHLYLDLNPAPEIRGTKSITKMNHLGRIWGSLKPLNGWLSRAKSLLNTSWTPAPWLWQIQVQMDDFSVKCGEGDHSLWTFLSLAGGVTVVQVTSWMIHIFEVVQLGVCYWVFEAFLFYTLRVYFSLALEASFCMAWGAQLRTWSQVLFLWRWQTIPSEPQFETISKSLTWSLCDMCQWPKGSCYHGGAHPELASTGMFWWGGWGYEIVTAKGCHSSKIWPGTSQITGSLTGPLDTLSMVRGSEPFFFRFCFTRDSPLPYVMLKFQRKGYKL